MLEFLCPTVAPLQNTAVPTQYVYSYECGGYFKKDLTPQEEWEDTTWGKYFTNGRWNFSVTQNQYTFEWFQGFMEIYAQEMTEWAEAYEMSQIWEQVDDLNDDLSDYRAYVFSTDVKYRIDFDQDGFIDFEIDEGDIIEGLDADNNGQIDGLEQVGFVILDNIFDQDAIDYAIRNVANSQQSGGSGGSGGSDHGNCGTRVCIDPGGF